MTNNIQNSQMIPISPLNEDKQQVEIFRIIWLDPNVQTDSENKIIFQKLQRISAHVETFNNLNSCKQRLQTYSNQEKIIFIVSGRLGEEIVPDIHDLKQIAAIYIFCLKPDKHKKWAKQYSKIVNIVTVSIELINHLSEYQKGLESVEDSKAFQIFQDQQKTNLNATNISFLLNQLLLEIFISSHLSMNTTKKDLARIFSDYCSDSKNNYHLELINEFVHTYEPKRVISWLICDTPVKRFINATLRKQNISSFFLLSSYLTDVYARLTTYPIRAVRVYKIQLMSSDQINYFKFNQNHYLLCTGFLYTTTTKPDLRSINNKQFQTVLLEIDAESMRDAAPFSYIDANDVCGKDRDTSHVLFMCGSIFKIGQLCQKEEFLWTLQLTLACENDIPILSKLKNQFRTNGDLCVIGDLLERVSQQETASLYYKCLLRHLPANHKQVSKIQQRLQKNSEIKSFTCLNNTQFIVIDLSIRLSELALGMLHAIHELVKNTLYIVDNESQIDQQRLSKTLLFIFTSSQYAAQMKLNFKQKSRIFILKIDQTKVDQRTRFTTGEDLICQLADELYRCYKDEAIENARHGNDKIAKSREDLANKIHPELRAVHHKIFSSMQNNQSTNSINTEIIFLKSDIQQQLGLHNIVSSYQTFNTADDCHSYLRANQFTTMAFLIVDIHCSSANIERFVQMSNVKKLYHHNNSTTINDIRYQLVYDLIAYFSDLGTDYKRNEQTEQAQKMFLKAKNLCDILADF